MFKLKNMPKDTAAELLRYLADQEDFPSVEKLAAEDISVENTRAVLRELADELARQAELECRTAYDVKNCKTLSKESKGIISCLSSREERALLTKFGLIDKNNPK